MSTRSGDGEETKAARGEWRTLLLVTCGGFVLFLIALCFLPNVGPNLRVFNMPSESMQPTIASGSVFLVSRASYGYSRRSFDAFDLPIAGRWPAVQPARGDVVVFRLPREQTTFFIKRIVGLPGDEIALRGGILHINGVAVQRRNLGRFTVPGGTSAGERFEEQLPNGVRYEVLETTPNGPYDNVGPHRVPAGHYFTLGDNRDNSVDSREMSPRYGVGFVPYELLLGRVVYKF